MPRIYIELLPPGVVTLPDLPGARHTVNLPDPPETVKTWTDYLLFIRDHPDTMRAVATALIAMAPRCKAPAEPL